MDPIVTRIAADTARAAFKRIPDMILNFIGWLWKSYWKLGMVGKCIATAVVVVIAILALGTAPLPGSTRASLTGDIEVVMIAAILVAILAGVIRGR